MKQPLSLWAGAYTALLFALYATAAVHFQFLNFPLWSDEQVFWPTTVAFSKNWPPRTEEFRHYHSLINPFVFVLFGFFEKILGAGVVMARWINYVASFGIILAIAFSRPGLRGKSALASLGLLTFPYFFWTSIHCYTDIVAAGFSLLGLICHRKGRFVLATLSFCLAIASRQYLVAMPIALFLSECFSLRHNNKSMPRWLSPLLAALTLDGWFLFFGGPGPSEEVLRYQVATTPLLSVMPEHVLYFLSALGFYFVLPEAILLKKRHDPLPNKQLLSIFFILLISFLIFPPRGNSVLGIPSTMGLFDAATRMFSPFWPYRIALLFTFALATCLRFVRLELSSWLVIVNAALMLKAHVAWDKYLLPVLVTLWFLEATSELVPLAPPVEAGAKEIFDQKPLTTFNSSSAFIPKLHRKQSVRATHF